MHMCVHAHMPVACAMIFCTHQRWRCCTSCFVPCVTPCMHIAHARAHALQAEPGMDRPRRRRGGCTFWTRWPWRPARRCPPCCLLYLLSLVELRSLLRGLRGALPDALRRPRFAMCHHDPASGAAAVQKSNALCSRQQVDCCMCAEYLLCAGCVQRVLDKHLDVLLADAPRRSVLFIDSSKVGADGGCAHC